MPARRRRKKLGKRTGWRLGNAALESRFLGRAFDAGTAEGAGLKRALAAWPKNGRRDSTAAFPAGEGRLRTYRPLATPSLTGGLAAIASRLFMSPRWRAYAPVCAALLHDHSFKQLRRHPAAEFWDAAAFCGWPQDCVEPARTQPEREGFPQPWRYLPRHCAITLRHGGAVGFAQASNAQYENADKRASQWNVAPSFLLMWKQVKNVKFIYACTVPNKPRSERPARARHRRLLCGGALELGLGTVTPLCGLSLQFGLPPGPAWSPTGATGRNRSSRTAPGR